MASVFGDNLGGAVGDLFGGIAGFSEANAYNQAASIEEQNIGLEQTSTALQEVQAQRAAYQTISSQKAEVGGAGFAAGGSALDLLRSSNQQASLTKGALALQGQIQENAYAQQAEAYKGQATAAQVKGAGGILGGILGIFGL